MLAFPLLSDPYAQALETIRRDERERRLRRTNGHDPLVRIPDDEDDDDDDDEDFENEPTRPLRLDRLHL